MADWSEIEIAPSRKRARKVEDVLSVAAGLLVVWDFLACAASGEAALKFYAAYVVGSILDFSALGPFWRDILFGSLIAALFLRASKDQFVLGQRSCAQLIAVAEGKCLLAFSALIVVGVLTRSTDDLARFWLALWFVLFVATTACTRFAIAGVLSRMNRRGELRETVAVIGSAGLREQVAGYIANDADVVGMFGVSLSCPEASAQHDDDLNRLLDMSRSGCLDSVVLAFDRTQSANATRVISRLKEMPVRVAVCPDDVLLRTNLSQTRLLGGIPMAVVADRPIKEWGLLAKTLLDKTVALILLVALAPLLLAIAVGIAATSPGPVIFRQLRRGWSGREFVIFKFRTMHVPTGEIRHQTLRADPRCTWIGGKLRRYSLDELPQLWNVLRGDMSLVGPRPHAEALHDTDRAGREIVAEYAQRHRVKPGLTGWAQVNGARGATHQSGQMQRRVTYDLYYIENWSLWLDLRILARTPLCMTGENVF